MSEKQESPAGKLRRIPRLAIIGAVMVVIVGAAMVIFRPPPLAQSEPLSAQSEPAQGQPAQFAALRPVSDFTSIADMEARSVALFVEAGRVIQHPRCMNCHPRTDTPTQTDKMSLHMPLVERGADGGGATTLRCSSCHRDANFEVAGVPGNPKWKLAPIGMGWQGKTLGQICQQIQTPGQGGMTRDELLHHMAEDELVGWAWHPGGQRAPAPGTQERFGEIIKAWLETGGRCPT